MRKAKHVTENNAWCNLYPRGHAKKVKSTQKRVPQETAQININSNSEELERQISNYRRTRMCRRVPAQLPEDAGTHQTSGGCPCQRDRTKTEAEEPRYK